jgi:hypothetical protein
LLTLQSLLTGAAVAFAVAALVRARRTAKRLERLTESYWELRYEHGQLRARLTALEPPQGNDNADEIARQTGSTAFVPLSSLKR